MAVVAWLHVYSQPNQAALHGIAGNAVQRRATMQRGIDAFFTTQGRLGCCIPPGPSFSLLFTPDNSESG
jgi:hypothetical protein